MYYDGSLRKVSLYFELVSYEGQKGQIVHQGSMNQFVLQQEEKVK